MKKGAIHHFERDTCPARRSVMASGPIAGRGRRNYENNYDNHNHNNAEPLPASAHSRRSSGLALPWIPRRQATQKYRMW